MVSLVWKCNAENNSGPNIEPWGTDSVFSFIKVGLRTQPSCQICTPRICCRRSLLGWQRVNPTAAWWLRHCEPRRIFPIHLWKCAAWGFFVPALALLTQSRWTMISCPLHQHLLLPLLLPVAKCNCIPMQTPCSVSLEPGTKTQNKPQTN